LKNTIEKRILRSINAHNLACAFSGKDFSHLGSRAAIDITLHRLAKNGTIRRVCRGIYDLPKHSQLLNQALSPDLDSVARAIARKFGWHIQINGATALGLLGLSQQIPGIILYASDGPSRKFKIGQNTIHFKHTSLKNARFSLRESSIIVQALKSLSADRITEEIILAIRQWLDPRLRNKVLRDTKITTGWIQAAIAKICQEEN
jgi:hypothetical protein